MRLCEYGCGKEAKFAPRKGMKKWCCEENWQNCPNMKPKLQAASAQPRGPLSVEHKHSLSDKAKMNWKDPNSIYNSTIHRSNISKKTTMLWTNLDYRTKQSKSRTGLKRTKKFCEEQSLRMMGHTPTNKITITKIKKKYPTFAKVEEMRYNPNKLDTKEIQVRCKNHNCPNSKEKDGWFTPINDQLHGRIGAIENPVGNEEMNFYCSEECKSACRLYGKTAAQLIKEDQIAAGHILEEQYTSEEYNTWRQEVLKRANYKCEYCGEKAEHCHHIKPQKLEPFFSLDPEYGVACCKNCHYKYGHPTGTECSTGNLANIICM